MSDRKPGFIRRLLVGTWRVLDFSRRFILTVLFLILVAMIVAAVVAPDLKVEERSTLVIAPVGEVVEEYTTSAADRALARLTGDEVPEVRLRDLLDALDSAAGDKRIERVLLRLDKLGGAGLATLREIGAAVDRARAAGKEVIAYGDWYNQRAYYLAARADEVYLNPQGIALLEGFGRYRTYFKDALDKLGIEARLFRVGEFKSAGETYVRSDASPEAREADLYWMSDLWQRYLTEIGAARDLSPAALQDGVENFPTLLRAAGGDTARLVLDAGLVDALTTRDELRELMIGKGVRDEDGKSFRQIAMDDYLAVLARERTAQRMKPAPIAVIVAQGGIADGDQPPGQIGGDSTSALIRKARQDDDVKAIVLRIDSPGGQVFPSEQIRREVELARRDGKPVVASMGDVAASGGYWIAMDADRIFADPATITGSIGIFGLWFNAPETMDKLGLHTDGVGTTSLVGAFDPTRPYDPRVGEIIQTAIDHGYQEFITKVARARESTPEAIDRVARGRVWSGAQAMERGLVDELGGLNDAIAHARSLAGLGVNARFAYLERELSPFERFLQGFGQSALARISADAGVTLPSTWLPARVRSDLAVARSLFEQRGGKPWATYAHCQCAAD